VRKPNGAKRSLHGVTNLNFLKRSRPGRVARFANIDVAILEPLWLRTEVVFDEENGTPPLDTLQGNGAMDVTFENLLQSTFHSVSILSLACYFTELLKIGQKEIRRFL